MWEANEEIARRGLEAVLRPEPDYATVNALFDERHEFVSFLDAVDGGRHLGAAGYRDWLIGSRQVAGWESSVEDVRAISADRVLAIIPTNARWVASGAEVGVQRLAAVLTVRAGRIVRTVVHGSPDEALAESGSGPA